jgi:hypothetical protein
MFAKLNPSALGVALGTLWGCVVLVVTWLNCLTGGMQTGWFAPLTHLWDTVLLGYYSGFFGGIWGGAMAFLYGLGVGAVLATLYNRFANPVEEATKPPAAPSEGEEAE